MDMAAEVSNHPLQWLPLNLIDDDAMRTRSR